MQNKNWEGQAARLFCFCIYGIFIYVLLKYILPVCLPLIIAFVIGAGVFSMARRCAGWTHLPHALCAVVILCTLAVLFGTLSVYLCRYLFGQIKQILSVLSRGGAESVLERAEELAVFRFVSSLVSGGREGSTELVSKLFSGALSFVSEFVGGFVSKALRATPSAFVAGVVSVIVCFYVAIDMRRICASAVMLFPHRVKNLVARVREQVIPVLKSFVGAYLKIYALTFAEVFLGLSILCPRFALLGAFGVATVDILPVLGAGIVLRPWGIAELLMENYFVGVGLLLLYVVISIVRQIAEPRLMGSAVGLSPFAAILTMFIGYRMLGFAGMLILPVVLSVAQRIRSQTNKK